MPSRWGMSGDGDNGMGKLVIVSGSQWTHAVTPVP